MTGIGRNVNIKGPVSYSLKNGGVKMPDCELLAMCPFFNDASDDMSEMAEMYYKEQYCKGDYTWCGRYLVFKALQRELEREGEASEWFRTEEDGVKATGVKT